MTTSTPSPKRRCIARRADGQPCRAWAVRPKVTGASKVSVTSPPLCVAHGGVNPPPLIPTVVNLPRADGYYDDHFDDEEFAILQAVAPETLLQSEIMLIRVVLRRLLVEFDKKHGLTGRDLEARAQALFRGAELIAHLLQHQRVLQGIGDDGLSPDIAQALDELSDELGMEL